MSSMTVAEEVAALLADRPTLAELTEMMEACDTVLHGIVRVGRDWQVDPSLAHLVRSRSPAYVVRNVRRGREIVEIARAALRAC